MNNIKNTIVAILLSLSCFSCNDVLEKGPLDKYSEEDVQHHRHCGHGYC